MMLTPSEVRYAARGVWTNAKKYGRVPPIGDQVCADCGEQATEYDHRDYTKPLEVDAVCKLCHKKRGQGYPPLRVSVDWYKPRKTRKNRRRK